MQPPDFIKTFVIPIENTGVDYFITGSVATMFYGEPRLTHDIDIVIALNQQQINLLGNAFPLDSYYFPPDDVVKNEILRAGKGQFNLIHHDSGLKADLFIFKNDHLHRWAMKNRLRITVDDTLLWVSPPEYVIIKKLLYYKEGGSDKHIRDIRGLLKQRSETINHQWLQEQIETFSLHSEWERCTTTDSNY
ncbi:MAG: hypothetical protein JNL74_17345 [Fibrobacteres bacterium]|nr:hypothetical protein [Fibrobacterota bacterium]